MPEPAFGPCLFDTSAESWLERSADEGVRRWFASYLLQHRFHVSAITVMERIRGYVSLLERTAPAERAHVSLDRHTYLAVRRHVWAVDRAVALIAGELAAMLPQPPTP